jgi:hypothetical protein
MEEQERNTISAMVAEQTVNYHNTPEEMVAEDEFNEMVANGEVLIDSTPEPAVQTTPIIESPVYKISTFLDMLSRGYTRTTKEKAYDASIGTIQDHFNLSKEDMKIIFSHPSLKGKKTKQVRKSTPLFTLIDDTVTETVVEENYNNN